MNANKKVDAMMNAKVDPYRLCFKEHLGLYDKLVLDLACAIERSVNPDYIVVSWKSQEEATDYFNEHGFIDTLDRLISLSDDGEIPR